MWYDPENPFKSDVDVLDAIRKEFKDVVLGKVKEADQKRIHPTLE